jgi:glycosyltransferase involved in cell wall biosynthesis
MRASIIINNYNYGQYLSEAIDSALNQSYADVEVIVVDDGSTDDSRTVIESFGNKIIPVFKANGGQASCFNMGFARSRGEIIFFLDADDFYRRSLVEEVMQRWQPGIAKLHWKLMKINTYGRPLTQMLPDDELIEGELRDQLIEGGPSQCGGPPHSPPTSGNAWSRHFLEQVLPMPEEPFRQGADNYLFVLAPLFGAIGKIDAPLGFYRVHGKNNTSKSSYLDQYFNRFEACASALSEHLERQGIQIDPSSWPRDHWYHKVKQAMTLVLNVIPLGSSFVLIDENHWVTESDFHGRTRIPFTQVNGEFNGAPVSDEAAIETLEEEMGNGAGYVVIPWSCAWYLSHYRGLQHYLNEQATCVLDDELVRIYELQPVAIKS